MGKKRKPKLGIHHIKNEIETVEQQYKVLHRNIAQLTHQLKKETDKALIKKGEHQALKKLEKELIDNEK